jgi:hypothetical protein
MKYIVALLMVVAMAVPAFAGQNEGCYAYITVDPAGDEAGVVGSLTPYSLSSVYVCLGGISEVEGEGVTVVSFLLNSVTVECPGVMGSQSFVSLLPGGLAIAPNGAFAAPGVTVSSTDCMPGPVVVVGKIEGFYLGGACCFKILDHGEYPRWVVDCQPIGVVDYYCVYSHCAVGGAVCPDGDPDCPPQGTPVEDSSWGSIKAMYQ